MNMQIIQNSQTLPGKRTKNKYDELDMYELEIGYKYKIIYKFNELTHEITYHFVRKQKGAYAGKPKIIRHPGAEDGIESLIRDSYTKYFMEQIILKRLVEKLNNSGDELK